MQLNICSVFDTERIVVSFWFSILLISSCKGAELNVGVRRLQSGHLNGRLFVTGKYLTFRCEVLPGVHSYSKEERTAFGYTFVSLGLTPSITIYNSTWTQTFIFNNNTWNLDAGEWQLVLPRSSFSFSDDICEEWMVSVQLDVDTNLLQQRSTLLDFHRVPVLLKEFGIPIQSSVNAADDGKFKSCRFGQSACSPDVAVAVCETEDDELFLGVTHGAFDYGSTTWSSLNLCSVVQACESLQVLSVVLSDSHILMLTDEGIIVSSSMKEYVSQVAFTRVDLPELLPWSQWTFHYNPVCSAGRDASEFEDLVFLLPQPTKNNSSLVAGFWSVPPYKDWTTFHDMTVTPSSWILSGYDLQTNMLVNVVQVEKLTVQIHELSVLTSSGDVKTKVPPVSLPLKFQPSGICFHPITNYFYLYGNQIMITSDGGTSFECLLRLEFDEIVRSCHPSKEDWLVFLTSQGNILYTITGQKRVIHLFSIQKSSYLIIDALGNLLQLVFKPRHQLIANPLDIKSRIKMSATPLRSTFSIHFILPWEVLVYEHNGEQLKSMEGAVLKHISSKSELGIKEVLPSSLRPNESGRSSTIRAVTAILRHQPDREFKPYCDLEVTVHSPSPSKMVLHCSDNATQGWDTEDAGKTIFSSSSSMSILILTTRNATEAVGVLNHPSLPKTQNDSQFLLTATQWEIFDTRSYSKHVSPAENLLIIIDNEVCTAGLSHSSQFQFRPEQAGFQVVTRDGTAIIQSVIDERLAVLGSQTGQLSPVLYPGEWALVDLTQAPRWYLSEDECLHVLQLDDVAARLHPVYYLDLGSSFTFRVIARTKDEVGMQNGQLMRVTLSNPDVVQVKTEVHHDQHNSEIMTATLTNTAVGRWTTALTISIPAASMGCKDTSLTLTFHCSCPPSKHLHFIYSPLFSDHVFLHGHPKDQLNRPLLQDLPVNYRPPSTRGKQIPTSEHIYNADPNANRPREHYEISKTSGYYKQCFGKMSREECGCTTELKLSSLAKNSDCRERAHRLIHPGKVTLKFVIREAERDDIPVEEPLAITLTEINDRIDFAVTAPSTPSLDHMEKLSLEELKLLNSTAVSLSLTGSGLYHFKARVAAGFSYCDLQDEFQYFVDLPPLASPTPTIVIAAVSLLMGGAFFLWYLQYLGTHPQLHGSLVQGMQCPSGVNH
ncbi:cation channel sperm-associated auxiliary subunit beta-like [Apostichopus japonicus]|uniref:cation channel sperm-associated auxiliary subunit beta-like n=1 Tax=Stichopus japonicus TaxID=307972 RepID=UPI003AB8A4EC